MRYLILLFMLTLGSYTTSKAQCDSNQIIAPDSMCVGSTWVLLNPDCGECTFCGTIYGYYVTVPAGAGITINGATYPEGNHYFPGVSDMNVEFLNQGDYVFSWCTNGCPGTSCSNAICYTKTVSVNCGISDPCGFSNYYGTQLDNSVIDVDYNPVSNEFLTVGLNGNNGFIATKIDGSGNVIWSRMVGSGFYPRSILRSSTGDYFIATDSTKTTSTNKGDVHIFKIDANGNFVWSKQFNSGSRDRNSFLVRSSDTEFFLIYNKYVSPGQEDLMICKLDENGVKVWDKQYTISYNPLFKDYIEDNDGGFTAVGESNSFTQDTTLRSGIIARFDSDGNLIDHVYHDMSGAPNFSYGYYKIIKETSGDYIVVGDIQPFGGLGSNGPRDILVRKFPNNNLLVHYWEKRIDFNSDASASGPRNAGIEALTEDADKNIYVSLYKYGAPSGYKAKIIQLDSSGNYVKTRRFTDLDAIRFEHVSGVSYAYSTSNIVGGFGLNDFYLARIINFANFCKTQSDTLVMSSIVTTLNVYSTFSPLLNVTNISPEWSFDYGNPTLLSASLCSSSSTCQLQASFSQTGALVVGSSVMFLNTSTDPSNNIISYQWSFGDGTVSTQQNPSHTYNALGSYPVQLIIQNDACPACFDTVVTMIVIGDTVGGHCQLFSKFTVDGQFCIGKTLSFTNQSYDLLNTINVTSWNFGDGTTSNSSNPTHVYATPGLYTVTLVVANNNPLGCRDTLEKAILIDSSCVLPCTSCIGTFSPTPNKKYILSAWAKEKVAGNNYPTQYTKPKISVIYTATSGVTSSGPFTPKGLIIDGWQRIEEEFFIPADAFNIQIKLESSSGDVYFDDIRVFPFDGSMKAYVYDPVTLKFVAELDERNFAKFYEYDEEGNMVRSKQETERGIMTIQETRSNIQK